MAAVHRHHHHHHHHHITPPPPPHLFGSFISEAQQVHTHTHFYSFIINTLVVAWVFLTLPTHHITAQKEQKGKGTEWGEVIDYLLAVLCNKTEQKIQNNLRRFAIEANKWLIGK
jgi:hypothetical protein